jgi:hypothetical protein
MTDMPERVWVGLARELDSNSRQVREIRYWGRSKFSNDCVQYTRTPDPLLEKMVEALRGMHEGEYIRRGQAWSALSLLYDETRAVLAEWDERKGGE